MNLYPLLMAPHFRSGKETPWGGCMLRDAFMKDAPAQTGESLEVSALPGRESVVRNGAHADKSFDKMIELWGEELTGATYWEHAGGVLEVAQQVTADAITKYLNVNVVYGDNVSNGLGALAAYEAAGRGLAEDGVPLTEIIASTDASSGELIKLADPTCSLKYALGMQPQIFAYAQVDMIMELINGTLDNDTYVERTTPDCYFNYYKDSVQDMQDWFNTQYNPATPLDLAAEIAK